MKENVKFKVLVGIPSNKLEKTLNRLFSKGYYPFKIIETYLYEEKRHFTIIFVLSRYRHERVE